MHLGYVHLTKINNYSFDSVLILNSPIINKLVSCFILDFSSAG